jgi:gamma-glutamyl hercynylcysteine S-oxide synthase
MLTAQRQTAIEQALAERIRDARTRSDQLFGIVRRDAIFSRPIPERHRIVFYIGHLEAFDWNLLHENVFGLKSFHAQFDRLFAFGIDPVGGGLPSDQPSDWPDLPEVENYVRRIREALDQKLGDVAGSDGSMRDGFPLDTLLNVAIEHRLMHVETLAYMLHQLPLENKSAPLDPDPFLADSVSSAPVSDSMVAIPAGVANLGLSRSGGAFGWDNEFEMQSAHVPGFEMDRYMVTNRQFLKFLAAGGYDDPAFWTEPDWNWKTVHGVRHPVFWKESGDRWLYQAMFREIPLPPDWPVYVSHAEAAAYARWAKKALPTEEQWQRAAYGSPEGGDRPYPWGPEAPNPRLGNFDFSRWDPAPVNAYPDGRSGFGVEGMLGNGWEWTSSLFAPFRGFEAFPFYRGYSADFFDGKHFVLKGGSPRTAACMLRPTFRNWFQPHYQYVYAGFRCVNV